MTQNEEGETARNAQKTTLWAMSTEAGKKI